jgi:hypothetical protein
MASAAGVMCPGAALALPDRDGAGLSRNRGSPYLSSSFRFMSDEARRTYVGTDSEGSRATLSPLGYDQRPVRASNRLLIWRASYDSRGR